MDFLTLLLRTVITYFIVFSLMRLMGKREIGKLSVFDLVISIMIAEIAVLVLEDKNKPMWEGFVPMAVLVSIQIIISYLALKFRPLRNIFDGPPSVLIQNGRLNEREMRKQRYSLDDLLMQLRQHKVTNIADVEFAALETDGKLSVIEKNQSDQNKSKAGLQGVFRFEQLPVPLIMDGKVQDDNLRRLNKTRFWLKNEIQAKGASDFKEVFFCSIDHRGNLYIDLKDKRR